MKTAVTRWKEKSNEGNNYNGDYLSHSSCDLLDKQGEDKMTPVVKDCFHCAYGDFDTTEEPCNRCLLSNELYPNFKSPEENRGQMTFDDLYMEE